MNAVKEKQPSYRCSLVNNVVRCECGGQVMVDASLHPLVDFGVGYVGSKFEVKKRYGKRLRLSKLTIKIKQLFYA